MMIQINLPEDPPPPPPAIFKNSGSVDRPKIPLKDKDEPIMKTEPW